MTDEQIKQNAANYYEHIINDDAQYRFACNCFVAGAHSMLEEIEQLKKAISSAQKAMAELAEMARNPWISVEERLPEKTKGVFSCEVWELERDKIVYYKDERGYIHTGYFNANNHWRDLDRDNAAIYTVTHWMPIYELKKGE